MVSIVLAILISAAAGTSEWGRLLAVVCLGATVLLVLRTAEARPRVRLIAAVVVGAAVTASGLSAPLGEGTVANGAIPLVGALLALVAPTAIVRALAREPTVTIQTIFGALCLYLLIGVFFAFLYSTVDAVTAEPFFAGGAGASAIDYLYFSFVTQATVGYGDLTAATDLGRMLAASEALIGQLYLVTVVALLVSNLGRPRRTRAD